MNLGRARIGTVAVLAGALALAVLVLALQPHRHAGLREVRCVACALHHQGAVPPPSLTLVVAPLLAALDAPQDNLTEPRSVAQPCPRAQGPPRA